MNRKIGRLVDIPRANGEVENDGDPWAVAVRNDRQKMLALLLPSKERRKSGRSIIQCKGNAKRNSPTLFGYSSLAPRLADEPAQRRKGNKTSFSC